MTSTTIGTSLDNRFVAATGADHSWQWLYKLGSAAAFLALIIIPITIIVYFVWPPPGTVAGHFAQFQSNWFVGLLGMDLLYLLTNVILLPTWLALYVALRRANESLVAVALTLGLMGTMALIAARPILEMYTLSDQYAAALTEMQQAVYLAAGEAMLALYHGTAFNAHYILGTSGLPSLLFLPSIVS